MRNRKQKNFLYWNRRSRIFVNRKYKDMLFQTVFSDKKDLLELYNAISNTSYSNADELIITTIDDVIYLSMKNDMSFIVSATLNLYEHQSTINPNMPIRGLLYFARLYDNYIEENALNIYDTKQVVLPLPQYVVFYNGDAKYPEEVTLNLSDAFEKTDAKKDWIPALECRARVININYGHNSKLMEKCTNLMQYATFVQRVRDNQDKGLSLAHAIDRTVEDCINDGILKDILLKNRRAVKQMVLTEYNEKLHHKTLWESGRAEGRAEGIEEGRAEGIDVGRFSAVFEMVRDGDITEQRGAQKLCMTEEEFARELSEYMKKK